MYVCMYVYESESITIRPLGHHCASVTVVCMYVCMYVYESESITIRPLGYHCASVTVVCMYVRMYVYMCVCVCNFQILGHPCAAVTVGVCV